MSTVIKNGTVLAADRTFKADVFIEGRGGLHPVSSSRSPPPTLPRFLSVYPQKGATRCWQDPTPTSASSIPSLPRRYRPRNQKSIIDYNVFEGFKVSGLPRYVLSRGELVWSHRKNDQAPPGRGKQIRRRPFPAVNRALSRWKA